ncbi:glycosyltransferase [Aeromicrobium wangtongii]|uniref:glycosyltransferase n=1 Tax=Aeromicrobium wangtongii TaxID=2969247 RepID=UPI0020177871|nr:glycosyltransferase [Aeromicrobium wangtongii]MCL3819634.1 hypothetical protein [Aeromicrobium wangtongii]
MIGYYVHHHGLGHLHRATAIAAALETPVVGLSSLPRPPAWRGAWLELPRDDDGDTMVDAQAHGQLHWVPEHHGGLRARMAEVSAWIANVEPQLMVVDVSVEVSLLARLHGVPVVTVVLPGDRCDPAHQLVHSVARRLLAVWPPEARRLLRGVDEESDRLVRVGGMSRFDGRPIAPAAGRPSRRRVVVLAGAGGTEVTAEHLDRAMEQTTSWEWTVLGGPGAWVDDPWDLLCGADVVVSHAGQNAIAEIAAARRPAVVIPQPRPFGEQDVMAAGLAEGRWPVVVRGGFPATGWEELLDSAAGLDGRQWQGWNDGGGAARAAALIEAEARATVSESR